MRRPLAFSTTSLLLSVAAHAAPTTSTLLFSGVVSPTCSITIGTPGVMDLDTDGKKLATNVGIGQPALATILTTGGSFKVSVSTPSAFTLAPTGGNSGTLFQSTYSLSGVTFAADLAGSTATPLTLGLTNLSVNLIATRPSYFPSGIYTAQTVVTCE